MATGLMNLVNAISGSKEEKTTGISGLEQGVLRPDGEQIANILMDRLGDPVVVAGIMGNIQHETGGSFDASQKQYGGGPGRGLFQMEGQMLKAYQGYLKKNGVNDSPYAQIDFLDSALKSDADFKLGAGNRKNLNNVARTGNPEAYALEFSNRFERPNSSKARNDLRQKYASEWYNKLKDWR